jgi:hypothetical protein
MPALPSIADRLRTSGIIVLDLGLLDSTDSFLRYIPAIMWRFDSLGETEGRHERIYSLGLVYGNDLMRVC